MVFLPSLQISHGLNPDVIVLGVTPGYALKLAQKIPNQGKFLNPGSAGMLVKLYLKIIIIVLWISPVWNILC